MQEVATKVNELYIPRLMKLSTAIAKEEYEKIAPELELLNNK